MAVVTVSLNYRESVAILSQGVGHGHVHYQNNCIYIFENIHISPQVTV